MKRKTYKFSSSIVQGGYLYAHKTANNEKIKNKDVLKNILNSIAKDFWLIDVTIKVYDSILFFFFMMKPKIVPMELASSIQEKISSLGKWNDEYIYTTVYDLQEENIKKYLSSLGFNYKDG